LIYSIDGFPNVKQLPLSVGLRDDCLLENFYPGDNAQAINHIQQLARGLGERFIFVWGAKGVGRTHILQGACHLAHQHQRRSVYLAIPDIISQSPRLLEGLERVDLVCLDDFESIAGNAIWEEALFHFFNRHRAEQRGLLIAAHAAPKALGIQLPDLQSRLTWGVTYLLHPLNDEDLLAALKLRAHQRGLELNDEVGMFLIRRVTRAMPKLYERLDRLDEASLAAKRRLTIPFVKDVLGL
jgi:DnaA-homolog protein